MAKKAKKDPQAILEKAEKFFNKGNYPLAKKEFETANKILQQDDITEKIKICDKEIAQIRAKELIKKGRKSLKKGNLQEAIHSFEEAYENSGEEWLPEKISELKKELIGRHSFEAAANAEASGEYEKAAQLYDQLIAIQDDQSLVIKKARSLVKAEKYDDAIAIFRNIELLDQGALYDYGFALAKLKQYHECLKIWDAIAVTDKAFLEQKGMVQSLFAEDIHNRFSKLISQTRNPEQNPELAIIYEEGIYLLQKAEDNLLISKFSIPNIVEYCRYAAIEQLWYEEDYEKLKTLLLPYPSDMNSELIALYAKIFFKLASISGEYLSDCIMFLLTAVYTSDIYEKLSDQETEREVIRKELIQKADELIKKYAETGDKSFKNILTRWKIEQQLIKELDALIREKESSHQLCTAQFAEKFKSSKEMCQLVQENREFFSDTEHYLKIGGYYSSGGTALFYLETGDYENAVASLPAVKDADEFTTYCKERVYFGYGLFCLENGDNRFAKYFESSAALFEKSPEYEKELIEKALDAIKPDDMRRYETALSQIHAVRATPEIEKALSLVMTRRCIDDYNDEEINLKNLEITVKKALTLDPENELAKGTMERLQVDIELEELNKAIDKFKINKACQIAAKSEYPEVKKEFFEFMEANLEHLDEADIDDNRKIFVLHDLSKWCARVDDTHSLLYEIDDMIADLECRR